MSRYFVHCSLMNPPALDAKSSTASFDEGLVLQGDVAWQATIASSTFFGGNWQFGAKAMRCLYKGARMAHNSGSGVVFGPTLWKMLSLT
eukprot:13160052-Alexandrium_andersonii.AAC.1